MAKMYFSREDAAQKLGVTPEALEQMVREGKLRAYRDGQNMMFKASEIEELAGVDLAGESDIQLTPAESGTHETLNLADDEPAGGSGDQTPTPKEDTVITSEGISIFDEEDLEIEAADPMAKTQIAPSIEDQINLEGGAGGSGLLDLTRESDDTSLGAEVLDHIDMEGDAGDDEVGQIDETVETSAAVAVDAPVVYDRPDPSAGLFSGLIGAGAIVMLLVAAVALAVMMGATPGYLLTLGANAGLVMAVVAVILIIGAVVGWFVGRSAAQRSTAQI